MAAYDLEHNPKKLGWGRVITGLVISIPMSLLWTVAIIARLLR